MDTLFLKGWLIDIYNYNSVIYFFSTAILKYIHSKFNLPDHWYPKDLCKQGRVDEALAWFPQNLRCGAYFLTVSP